MKILMLTPRFPYPPQRGDTVRSWYELEHLARRHDVWLASLDERPPAEADIDRVRKICGGVAVLTRSHRLSLVRGAWSLLAGDSLTEGYFHNDELNRVVRQWTRTMRFDAVLAFTSAMAPAADEVRTRRVLDMCDVDSRKWEAYADQSRSPLRWLYAWEASRLRRGERRWVRTHDVTLIVNQREREQLLTRALPRETDVLPTCVQLPDESPAGLPREPIVGCVGSMFYPPNARGVEWFGRQVWPLVKQNVPAAQWWIVGQRPTRSVRRWGRQPGVRVTGSVGDTRPYMNAIRVFANPVWGDLGVQSKVLGALAAGKACVVTPDTAAGIDRDGAEPFLIARTGEEFAAATARLLIDDDLAIELGERGRALIARRYQSEGQMWRLERALGGVTPAAPVGAERFVPEEATQGNIRRCVAAPREIAEEIEAHA